MTTGSTEMGDLAFSMGATPEYRRCHHRRIVIFVVPADRQRIAGLLHLVLRRALSAALAGNGCGCFVPDLTRLTTPQCAGARRHALYLICTAGANAAHAIALIQKKTSRHPRNNTAAIHMPSSCQMLSTRRLTASVMVIGAPHSRLVSPGHLLVASMPILLPRPLTGEAKSR